MNTTVKHAGEKLSAFFDGETLQEDELKALINDKDALKQWDSFTKIRAELRDENPQSLNLDNFADNISDIIANEPVPTCSNASNDAEINTPAQTKINAMHRFSGLYRFLAQSAIAASVAAICVLGVKMYQNVDLSSNSSFAERSYVNGSVSVAPVANNDPMSQSVKVISNTNTDNTAKDKEKIDKNQIKLVEEQKQKEMNTIDALINDHTLLMRTVSR